MIPIEQNKIENYIADYYRSYFQMDSVYNDWALVNKIQDTTLFVEQTATYFTKQPKATIRLFQTDNFFFASPVGGGWAHCAPARRRR